MKVSLVFCFLYTIFSLIAPPLINSMTDQDIVIPDHHGAVTSLAFNATGSLLAVGGQDAIDIYEYHRAFCPHFFYHITKIESLHLSASSSVVFNPLGPYLMVNSGTRLNVYTITNTRACHTAVIECHEPISTYTLSHDGHCIFVGIPGRILVLHFTALRGYLDAHTLSIGSINIGDEMISRQITCDGFGSVVCCVTNHTTSAVSCASCYHGGFSVQQKKYVSYPMPSLFSTCTDMFRNIYLARDNSLAFIATQHTAAWYRFHHDPDSGEETLIPETTSTCFLPDKINSTLVDHRGDVIIGLHGHRGSRVEIWRKISLGLSDSVRSWRKTHDMHIDPIHAITCIAQHPQAPILVVGLDNGNSRCILLP